MQKVQRHNRACPHCAESQDSCGQMSVFSCICRCAGSRVGLIPRTQIAMSPVFETVE
jgi:hypothetical protein